MGAVGDRECGHLHWFCLRRPYSTFGAGFRLWAFCNESRVSFASCRSDSISEGVTIAETKGAG